jgi:site-specific DNA-methyltransferase (adenine-specific)
VNLGDSYSGSSNGNGDKNLTGNRKEVFEHKKQKSGKQPIQDKSLLQIPSRFAIGMTDRGWILRNELIWYKPNCMPSSVKDRFTMDFEKIFFFVKNKKYWFETQYEDTKAKVIEPRMKLEVRQEYNAKYKGAGIKRTMTRNKRSVWRVTTKPYKEAHFATYPEELIETPIKAGCPENGIVLDPFFGSGTTGLVALKQNKNFIGIELNPEYIKLAEKRLEQILKQYKLTINY